MKGLLVTACVTYAVGLVTFAAADFAGRWGQGDLATAFSAAVERGLAWPARVWIWLA